MRIVTFRKIEEGDLETIRKWRNSPGIAQNMFTAGVIREEDQRKWYDSVKCGERGFCWLVESDGVGIGYASLSCAERADDTLEFGLYIGNQRFIGGVWHGYTLRNF